MAARRGTEFIIAKPGPTGRRTVNEANGDIIAFVEDRHPPAPIHVYVSSDDGKVGEDSTDRSSTRKAMRRPCT